MKKLLIILFGGILTLCMFVPLFFFDDVVEYLSKASTILSGLCGLATLYIAILLYDRYGIESKTKERVLTAIEETVSEFLKVHFVICYYSKDMCESTPSDYIISLSFQGSKEWAIDYFTPETLSAPLYYKASGMYGCSQLVNNTESKIFLPKSIADAIRRLTILKYEAQNMTKDTRPVTTLSASSDKISNLNDSLDGTDTNLPEKQYSVIEFIEAYYGVKEAILSWYQNNNIDTEDLNLN